MYKLPMRTVASDKVVSNACENKTETLSAMDSLLPNPSSAFENRLRNSRVARSARNEKPDWM